MKSILIADGNDTVAEMFAYVFALHDWSVTRYSDGTRAGDDLRGRAHHDAVLVSNRLEGMNGLELIALIRALEHRRDVAVVMVTGTVEVKIVAAALAAGADEVLYKPVDLAALVATVSKCVERGRPPGA